MASARTKSAAFMPKLPTLTGGYPVLTTSQCTTWSGPISVAPIGQRAASANGFNASRSAPSSTAGLALLARSRLISSSALSARVQVSRTCHLYLSDRSLQPLDLLAEGEDDVGGCGSIEGS